MEGPFYKCPIVWKPEKSNDVINERRIRFVGHSFHNKDELLCDLLDPFLRSYGMRRSGRPPKTFIDQLVTDSGHKTTMMNPARLEWCCLKNPSKLDAVSKL